MALLPTTGLTLHADASTTAQLWTTFVNGGPHTGTPPDGGSVAVWGSTDSAGRILKQHGGAALPVWRSTSPLLPLPCLDFTGGQRLRCMTNLDVFRPGSEVLSASAFTLLLSFYAETVVSTASTFYQGHALIGDELGYRGVFLHLLSGVPKVSAYNYDGTQDYVTLTAGVAGAHVLMVRHEAGFLYAALDYAAEQAIASGNTTNLSGGFTIGGGTYGGGNLDGRIGEIAIYNTALGGTALTDARTYFTDKWIAPAASVVTYVTQDVIEVVGTPDGPALVTQHAIEALAPAEGPALVSQHVIEALAPATGPVRVSQDVIEALAAANGPALVSQHVIEVLFGPPDPLYTQVVLEVLTSGVVDPVAGDVVVSQVTADALSAPDPFDVRVSTLTADALSTADPFDVRVSQVTADALSVAAPFDLRLSHLSVDVLMELPPTPGGVVPAPQPPPTGGVIPLRGKARWFITLRLPNGQRFAMGETELTDDMDWPSRGFGRKPAKILNISDFERTLSAEGYQKSSGSVIIADLKPTRAWREISNTTTIEGAEIGIYCIDDDVRRARGVPYVGIVGEVVKHTALDELRFQFDWEDVLGRRLTAVGEDPKLPPHALNEVEFPGLAKSMSGKFAPVALGKFVTGKGLLPGFLIAENLNLHTMFGGTAPDAAVDAYVYSEFALSRIEGLFYNIMTWGAKEQHLVGWFVAPTPANATGFYYISDTVTGPTGDSEPGSTEDGPVWPTDIGATVVDGGVTWRCYAEYDPEIRFPVPPSAYGVDLTMPFQPSWYGAINAPGGQNYVDYNGRRYGGVVFLRRDHIYAAAIREQRCSLFMDAYGVAENPDGSGRYFSTAEQTIAFVTVNLLFNESTGLAYFTMPAINGVALINQDSIAASEAVARARTGGSDYTTATLLGRGGQQQSGFSLWTELLQGTDLELGPDRFGAVMFAREDPDAPAKLALNDLRDIVQATFGPEAGTNVNKWELRWGYRFGRTAVQTPTPKAGQPLPARNFGPHSLWESDLQILYDEPAKTAVRQLKKKTVDNFVVQDDVTARSVAASRYGRFIGPAASKDGRRMFKISGGLGILGRGNVVLDLNDVVAITSVEGLSATGYQGKRGRITTIRYSPSSGLHSLEGPILHPYPTPPWFVVAPPVEACEAQTMLFHQTFESGQPLLSLIAYYVQDCENTNGQGLRGSAWGVRGIGSAAQKYACEFRFFNNEAHAGRLFRIEADFDHADALAGGSGAGLSAFTLGTGPSPGCPWLDLFHGVGATRSQLQLFLPRGSLTYGAPVWTSPTGLIVPGTTQQIKICGTMSTVSGETVNTDGAVRVIVDNVVAVELTGQQIANPLSLGGQRWTLLRIGPMGRFDNCNIYD